MPTSQERDITERENIGSKPKDSSTHDMVMRIQRTDTVENAESWTLSQKCIFLSGLVLWIVMMVSLVKYLDSE